MIETVGDTYRTAFTINGEIEDFNNFINNYLVKSKDYYYSGIYRDYIITGTLKNPDGTNQIQLDADLITNGYRRVTEDDIKNIINQIGINNNTSEREAAIKINDYICSICNYDNTYTKSSAYNCLEESATCTGYSILYKILCNYVGIECEVMIGKANNGGHSWNKVKINNEWYYNDTTWNDTLNNQYLLSNILWSDHIFTVMY